MIKSFVRSGIPSSRMVLLKGVTDSGFTFFTNYGSHKAQEIVKTYIFIRFKLKLNYIQIFV